MTRYQVAPDDALISVMGTIGRAPVVPMNIEPGIINPRLVLYRVLKHLIHPRYLQAFLNSPTSQDYFSLATQGTTMEDLNMTYIGELEVALPPLNEQLQILGFIRQEETKIGTLADAATCTIGLLKERRNVLLATAGTDQIDMRSAMPQLEAQTTTTIS